ncbi:cardiolipin synthase [Ihubacter sp. rT4E-8]|uniref:cardiolipin synthase n=1 Tax=Ihubacter sp. rT4E-8 TaxID=3242369 RepID=UPI003CEFDF4F
MTYFISFFTENDWTTLIYCVNLIIALTIIFLERKNPAATLAWILVLYVLPILGIFLYLMLSQNISRQKIYRLSEHEKRVMGEELREQTADMEAGRFLFENETAKSWKRMIKLNQVYGNAFLTQNNEIELLTDGKQMFQRLIHDIRHANHSIHVMSYIIKDDRIGKQLIEVLTEKAKEGVEVRLLMDAMGSRFINDWRLRDYLGAGGKAAYFFKPKLKYLYLKMNYRNHRKIAVIDGKCGYIGGFNIAREYLGLKRKFGYWRDTHIRIKGGSVQDLNARFIMDWRFASGEQVELSQVYFGQAEGGGNCAVQIVSSGPDSTREEIKRSMMRMITFAEKSVYVQTPYFVPDPSMLESLKMAAQSGVDVRIMIPCMPDHIFVYWATLAYCGELIRSGARVFIYNNGFLHAKTLVVDGEVSTVGSANFDRRSFRLNFESNAFIYDQDFASRMERQFLEDMKMGYELTLELYEKRTHFIRFKEAISRLLSDIL